MGQRGHLTPRQRVRLGLLSTLALAVTVACSLFRDLIDESQRLFGRATETPVVLCYQQMALTPTPPVSPLPTPTVTLEPESREALRDRLLAQGRFPEPVARGLEGE